MKHMCRLSLHAYLTFTLLMERVFINLQVAQQLCVYITSFEGHMYSRPCAINIYTVTTTYTQIHMHAGEQ